MSIVSLIKRNLASYASVKVALTIIGLGISIPLFSLLYWAFDSAYLASFGVGPEIFSRPVFSSKLMVTWVVLGAVTPVVWVLGLIAFLLFVVLFVIFYRKRKSEIKASQGYPDTVEKTLNQPMKMMDVFERSFTPPSYLFLVPLIIFLLLIGGAAFMSGKAKTLASNQVEAYVKHEICLDTFNNNINGCYSISDEPEGTYLVVVNSEKLLIYLSREERKGEVFVFVNIKDKLTKQKIVRQLRPAHKIE